MNEAIRVALEENDVKRLIVLSWLLATTPDNRLRDATRAVDLATRACEFTDYRDVVAVDTLAAVYAESGDFEVAVEWSEEAIRLLDGSRPPEVRERMLSTLAIYRAHKPYREHTATRAER